MKDGFPERKISAGKPCLPEKEPSCLAVLRVYFVHQTLAAAG
jgi:hypothetical protein